MSNKGSVQGVSTGELERRMRRLTQENAELEKDNDKLSRQIEQLQRTMQDRTAA